MILIVLVPLMVLLEFANQTGLFQKIASAGEKVLKRFSLSIASAFPLLIGLFLGINFGAGVLLQSSRDGSIDKRELNLVCIFLGLCHAVIEDNMIFILIGANWVWLVLGRLVIATTTLYVFSRYVKT